MSTPGPAAEIFGSIVYELTLLQPFIPTYLHLLLSALFPIYTGAHASLSRPKSALKPDPSLDDEEEEDVPVEIDQRMERLSPIDAVLYPLLAGCMLGGLYFLLKWLNNPAMLNKVLNWYLSLFGVLSISKLLTDSMNILVSFIFPAGYSCNGTIWDIKQQRRETLSRKSEVGSQLHKSSPLPGLLSQLPLPMFAENILWACRGILLQPLCKIEFYLINILEAMVHVGLQDILGIFTAFAAVLYFNLVDKPWWLTNILGFGFSYSALQLMSPTTCWTGTLVLTSLFFYDIYFVFFTPIMVTVATGLDIPVKLLFPRPATAEEDHTKVALSMLGLGDIVIPGMMIGFALRFDLYLLYLKKQTQQLAAPRVIPEKSHKPGCQTYSDETKGVIVKANYQPASGSWGERFWLAPQDCASVAGSIFPKTYFYASIIGYTAGMLCTLGVMHIYHHGQPALLYLVPCVLGSLWMTAFVKGDIKTLWEYTEADDESESKGKDISPPKDAAKSVGNAEYAGSGKISKEDVNSQYTAERQDSVSNLKRESGTKRRESKTLSAKRIIYFSVSIPPTWNHPVSKVRPIGSLEDELQNSSKEIEVNSSTSSSRSSTITSPKPRTLERRNSVNEEAKGERQKRE